MNPDENGVSTKDDFNNSFSNVKMKQEMMHLGTNYTHMILQFTGIN